MYTFAHPLSFPDVYRNSYKCDYGFILCKRFHWDIFYRVPFGTKLWLRLNFSSKNCPSSEKGTVGARVWLVLDGIMDLFSCIKIVILSVRDLKILGINGDKIYFQISNVTSSLQNFNGSLPWETRHVYGYKFPGTMQSIPR